MGGTAGPLANSNVTRLPSQHTLAGKPKLNYEAGNHPHAKLYRVHQTLSPSPDSRIHPSLFCIYTQISSYS